MDGFNVNTMVLQVPKSQLRGPNDGVIGIWTTASRRSIRIQGADGSLEWRGPFVQVSRLGMPLVNEVVVPIGFKDYFNGSNPRGDGAYLPKVNDPELPHLINAVYGLEVPDTNPAVDGVQRSDLVQVFLTGLPGLNKPTPHVRRSEMLRLNMDVAPCTVDCSTLGAIDGDVAGFPNGRRLTDDIIDIALRVVEGFLDPRTRPVRRHPRRRCRGERLGVPGELPLRRVPALRVGPRPARGSIGNNTEGEWSPRRCGGHSSSSEGMA